MKQMCKIDSATHGHTLSAWQWSRMPIPGSTNVYLDHRILGTISLTIGSWLTAASSAKSMHIMASFRNGAIGTYVDDVDLSPRGSGEH